MQDRAVPTSSADGPPNPRAGVPWALITVVLWASSFPCIRIALDGFAPVQLAALRCGISTLGMVPLLWWLSRSRSVAPRKRDLAPFFLCAAFGIVAYHMALNYGQTTISAGAAGFIVNTVPVITAMMAFFIHGERLGRWAWVGSSISLTGVLLIASNQPGGLRFGGGSVLVLLAALLQASFFLAQRPLIRAYGPLACAAWVMCMGTGLFSPWLPAGLRQWEAAGLRSQVALVYLGVVPSFIGNLTWSYAQKHLGPTRASNFLYLVPPVTVVIAAVTVPELPSVALLVGGALAIGGVLLVNLMGRRVRAA